MRLRSGLAVGSTEGDDLYSASASASESMEEDYFSTEAVWGSQQTRKSWSTIDSHSQQASNSPAPESGPSGTMQPQQHHQPPRTHPISSNDEGHHHSPFSFSTETQFRDTRGYLPESRSSYHVLQDQQIEDNSYHQQSYDTEYGYANPWTSSDVQNSPHPQLRAPDYFPDPHTPNQTTHDHTGLVISQSQAHNPISTAATSSEAINRFQHDHDQSWSPTTPVDTAGRKRRVSKVDIPLGLTGFQDPPYKDKLRTELDELEDGGEEDDSEEQGRRTKRRRKGKGKMKKRHRSRSEGRDKDRGDRGGRGGTRREHGSGDGIRGT